MTGKVGKLSVYGAENKAVGADGYLEWQSLRKLKGFKRLILQTLKPLQLLNGIFYSTALFTTGSF